MLTTANSMLYCSVPKTDFPSGSGCEHLNKMKTRPIHEIAGEIQQDWKNVHYAAKPYLAAMFQLTTPESTIGADNAKSVVIYFLSNARSWRGEKAKEIKKELKEMFNLK